jgi:hypothetical protein
MKNLLYFLGVNIKNVSIEYENLIIQTKLDTPNSSCSHPFPAGMEGAAPNNKGLKSHKITVSFILTNNMKFIFKIQ